MLQTVNTPYHLTIYENYQRDRNLSTVWNDLIRRSDAEYICILNNDTVPQGDWLEKLLSTFQEEKRLGAVGPISNCAGGLQGGHQRPTNGKIEASILSGFCAVFPKKVWEEVGGFDEDFHLYGEDSLFFKQVIKKGYRLIIRLDTFVYHHGHKSTEVAEARGKNITQIRKDAANKYREKLNGLTKT